MPKKEENEIKKDVSKEIKQRVINDLNKEIKATINENVEKFREEFKEEISDEINNEVVSAIRREEKKLLHNKNYAIFKKDVFIVLLIILVGYFGYCLYDVKYFDFMKSECEKNGTCNQVVNENGEVVNKKEEIVKDKNWYIENYGYLLDSSHVSLNQDQVSSYYLYSNDYKLNEIKASYLLNMAYQHLNSKSIKTNSLNVTVDAKDLKEAYQDLFGTVENYKDTSFTYNCLKFVFDKEKEKYVADNHKCSASNKEILETINDMYEEDNKIYILTTATIFDKTEESFYTFDNLFEPILVDVNKNDLESNIKKLNRYQYIYKKLDDKYYLDSITKLK